MFRWTTACTIPAVKMESKAFEVQNNFNCSKKTLKICCCFVRFVSCSAVSMSNLQQLVLLFNEPLQGKRHSGNVFQLVQNVFRFKQFGGNLRSCVDNILVNGKRWPLLLHLHVKSVSLLFPVANHTKKLISVFDHEREGGLIPSGILGFWNLIFL